MREREVIAMRLERERLTGTVESVGGTGGGFLGLSGLRASAARISHCHAEKKAKVERTRPPWTRYPVSISPVARVSFAASDPVR